VISDQQSSMPLVVGNSGEKNSAGPRVASREEKSRQRRHVRREKSFVDTERLEKKVRKTISPTRERAGTGALLVRRGTQQRRRG